jgi:hypothetical protein
MQIWNWTPNHNTPPFPLRNLILDCYSNVFQSLIISTNYSIHLDIFQIFLKVMVAPPPHPPSSNITTSLTSLWLLIDILWKLSNIPTEVTMAKSGCWLLRPAQKITHCFSVLIQPTSFKSTPSSLVFEINSENQDTNI